MNTISKIIFLTGYNSESESEFKLLLTVSFSLNNMPFILTLFAIPSIPSAEIGEHLSFIITCFHFMDSIIPLLLKLGISSFEPSSLTIQTCWCQA